MEFFFGLIGLALVLTPFVALFFAIRANNRIDDLRRSLDGSERRPHVDDLVRRIDDIERRLHRDALARAAEAGRAATGARPPENADSAEAATPETMSAPAAPNAAPAAARADDLSQSTEPSAPPPAPPAEPPPPAAPEAQPGLEERLGTRWVVWVGGVALALGGVFLVRYSIEQGLIGPGVRIFLGALLAAALIAGGEGSRRRQTPIDIAAFRNANIPSILTAAGTITAFATVYAAYALYDFLAPAAAFVLLGIVGVAAFAAAVLHGPALAVLGVVGSYVTPLLVATAQPNYWALYIYLAVVAASAFALARARLWRWLVICALVPALLWMLPGIDGDALAAHALHAIAGFALVAIFIVPGLMFGPDTPDGAVDLMSSLSLAGFVLAAALLVLAQRHDDAAVIVFTILVAATIAVAWRAEAATAAVPAAAALTVLVMAHWALEPRLQALIAVRGPLPGLPPEPITQALTLRLVLGALFAALFGGVGFLAQGRSRRPLAPIQWAAAAALTPLAILLALYDRITAFETSIPFAAVAVVIAAAFAWATERLDRRRLEPGGASAAALFASGAVCALGLALAFALEKGWLTIALALMVPGLAWVEGRRPLAFLRWLAAAVTVVVLLRVAWEPRIVGADLGTTPIFNWLLWGYGAPAASFWFAGHRLAKRADDKPTRMVQSAAILFTVLLAFLEIRHYANGGDVYRPAVAVTEIGLQVSTSLAMCIGLEWVRARTGSIVHDIGVQAIAVLALAVIVIDLGFIPHPRLNLVRIDGVVFNIILLNYGLPAILATVLALIARTSRPMAYRAVAAGAAVVLALAYLTLTVKRAFRGPVLWQSAITDAENYAYSVVWLVFGLVLLAIGGLLRSLPARLAAGAVIMLTVAKVFLIDTSHLTGIWRALSLIGLGLPLVIIGYVYQRYFLPMTRSERES